MTIGLHRSLFLGGGLLAGHLAAAFALALTPWPLWVRLGLGLAVVASAGLSWKRRSPSVTALRLGADGRLECRPANGDGFIAAELLPGATVHPWLTVVRLKTAASRLSVVIAPDSLAPEDFRRLRVWLRWRAEFSASKGAA